VGGTSLPWYLDELGRSGEPDWYFEDRGSLPDAVSRPHVIPDASLWPLRIRLRKPRKALPHFTVGPSVGIVVVSKTFKDLVEAWDPVKHPDGTLWDGEDRFMFKMGGFVEGGIIVDKSDVAPQSTPKGTFIGYFPTSQSPRLMWNADAIKGRHLWADLYFKSANVVSDEFYAEITARKIGSFLAIEGRVEG
jgi:hypothetical protein